jgi:hypothetical protein
MEPVVGIEPTTYGLRILENAFVTLRQNGVLRSSLVVFMRFYKFSHQRAKAYKNAKQLFHFVP